MVKISMTTRNRSHLPHMSKKLNLKNLVSRLNVLTPPGESIVISGNSGRRNEKGEEITLIDRLLLV